MKGYFLEGSLRLYTCATQPDASLAQSRNFRQYFYMSLLDWITRMHESGGIPKHFRVQDIERQLSGQFSTNYIRAALANFEKDTGTYVKLGYRPQFKRVSPGLYEVYLGSTDYPEKPKSRNPRIRRKPACLNPRSDCVNDELFRTNRFFDPRDLVQVKYEMLRRTATEGVPVSRSAVAFGFSRPSFYQAQASFRAGGLTALIPKKRATK